MSWRGAPKLFPVQCHMALPEGESPNLPATPKANDDSRRLHHPAKWRSRGWPPVADALLRRQPSISSSPHSSSRAAAMPPPSSISPHPHLIFSSQLLLFTQVLCLLLCQSPPKPTIRETPRKVRLHSTPFSSLVFDQWYGMRSGGVVYGICMECGM